MNPTSTASRARSSPVRANAFLLVALAVGLGAVAISRQSFWIDEACTATKAIQPTLAKWWREFVAMSGSDLQMPLYMLYVWAWEKLAGHSEWWLRAANLPWFALGLLAVAGRQKTLVVVAALSAFVWFYLDEARPYAMQIGSSLLLLGSLWHLAEGAGTTGVRSGERAWVGGFCLGLVALSGSSMLGMIWSGAAVATALAVLGWPGVWRILRRRWATSAVTAVILLALAGFYLWTLNQGARATPGSTGVGNVVFVGYELLGFSGLGPGRFQIRAEGLRAFPPFALPLAVYSLVLVAVLFAGCRQIVRQTPRRVLLGVAGALGAAVVFLLAAAVLKHFRVLGRHFAPLAPVLFVVLAFGLRGLWERGGWRRWLAFLFVLTSLGSIASLRVASRHAKDDYRTAVEMARAAAGQGQRVWWSADRLTGGYYGLRLSPEDRAAVPGEVWPAFNVPEHSLANQPPPDLVIQSKPDLYDDSGAVGAYLAGNHYRLAETLPAFSLWRKTRE